MGKFTYRLPIIHVDSNFERRCETANGSLCFSMHLLTLSNHTQVYMYKCKHLQNMYIRTNVNRCKYFCLLHLCNLQVTKNMCTCIDGVLYFCLLHLCNGCRCDDVEDGTTEPETFWSRSVIFSEMLFLTAK